MSGQAPDFQPGEIERLRTVSNAAGVALWSWHPGDGGLKLNGRAQTMWGVEEAGPVTFDDLAARIIPEDLDRVRTAFEPACAAAGEFTIDFRVLRNGEVRWLAARGKHSIDAADARVAFSIFFDVTEHERMEERRRILTAEMEHRVKNSFAVASALTCLVARSAPTPERMARDLQSRFAALCRAHELVRPFGQAAGRVSLADLVTSLLAAYESPAGRGERLTVRVPHMLVGEVAATTLALVLHELGTNAIKYGALSAAEGTLDVSASLDGPDLVIIWTERGGPPVGNPANGSRFGTKLVEHCMCGQLGGSANFAWDRQGVTVILRLGMVRVVT